MVWPNVKCPRAVSPRDVRAPSRVPLSAHSPGPLLSFVLLSPFLSPSPGHWAARYGAVFRDPGAVLVSRYPNKGTAPTAATQPLVPCTKRHLSHPSTSAPPRQVTPPTLGPRCSRSFGFSPELPVPLTRVPTLARVRVIHGHPADPQPPLCHSPRSQGEEPPLGCAGLCASLQRRRLCFSRSISSSSSLSIWTLLHQESPERKAINAPRAIHPCDASQPILL